MEILEQLLALNGMLLTEMPQYRAWADGLPAEAEAQWRLFRSLVHVREPRPVSQAFLTLQDSLLQRVRDRRGVTDLASLTPVEGDLYVWRGDITTLRVDGIVNAANSGLTGCYAPCHGCIDNAIHTFAGVQLRLECAAQMEAQGFPEPTGRAKLTQGYNLPCDQILHTVGPVVSGSPTREERAKLASCYRACLELAEEHGLRSLAFCCVSTGEFHFPRRGAAEIAVKTVREYQRRRPGLKILFDVFSGEDERIYRTLLSRRA